MADTLKFYIIVPIKVKGDQNDFLSQLHWLLFESFINLLKKIIRFYFYLSNKKQINFQRKSILNEEIIFHKI